MKHHITRAFLAVVSVMTCYSLGLAPRVLAADDTQFEVKILPQDCLFEIINDGTNEIRYLTPAQCGQIVPTPEEPTQPPEQSSSPTDPAEQPDDTTQLPLTPGAEVFFPIPGLEEQIPIATDRLPDLYLNNFDEYSSSAGKILRLKPGQKAYFGVGVGDIFELHSVTINAVGENYVDITVASKPISARIYVGQTQQFDVTEDGKNDIEISLIAIRDGIAEIYFRQLGDVPTEVGARRMLTIRNLAPFVGVIASGVVLHRLARVIKSRRG